MTEPDMANHTAYSSVPGFFRSHYVKITLAVLLFIGFWLRSYHMDYPSVGYHNMKENEYLSETLNYFNKGPSIHREVFFFGRDNDVPYFEEYPQLPLIPYAGYLTWKLFGKSFWSLRLQIILFSLGTIILSYLITKRLSGDSYLSLLTAAVMTILPINVFYGRNIQPESPALFFMMLFFLLFLRWKEAPVFKRSFSAGLALAVTGLYKASFLMPCMAVLPLFPFRKFYDDMKARVFAPYAGYLVFLVFPLFLLLVNLTNVNVSLFQETAHRVRLFEFLAPDYWKANYFLFESFWEENYSVMLGSIFIIGTAVFIFRKSPFRAFFAAYLLSFIPYLAVFSSFFKGHNYYQMPYVYLVSFCIAYVLAVFFDLLSRLLNFRYIRAGALLVLALSMGTVMDSIRSQFDTQFFGIDVAGDLIREKTAGSDRFLKLGSAQHAGVCFFAERFCDDIPKKTARLVDFEKKFNSRFIYIDAGSMKQATALDSWEYIKKNYGMVQIGFIAPQGTMLAAVHYVLEKGQQTGHTEMAKMKPEHIKDYELTYGSVPFYVIEP